MDEQGAFVAEVLDSGIAALAADTVLRQQERHGPLEGVSFEEWRGETEVSLRYLAEALAAGEPALFASHVAWLRAAYAARGLPDGLLEARLRALHETLGEELPDAAANAARACVAAAFGAAGSAQGEAAPGPGGRHSARSRRFLLALLEARRQGAIDEVLAALDDGVPADDIRSHVIAAAQAEMGRLWQRGEVHVAEEHLGSRIAEDALAALRQRSAAGTGQGRRVLVASVEGDLHDIGARIVADAFDGAGWDALFLGANVPSEDLAAALLGFGAELLALSMSLGLFVRRTARTIERVRAAAPGIPILVGGEPFASVPGLREAVGADAWAGDGASAVAEAERLLQR